MRLVPGTEDCPFIKSRFAPNLLQFYSFPIIEVYFLLFASAFIEAYFAIYDQVLKRQPRDGLSLCRSYIQMAGSEVYYLTFVGNI